MRRVHPPRRAAVVSLGLLAVVAAGVLGLADRASAQRSINCASEGKRYRYCSARTYGSARIDKRFSDAPCTFGKSWGFDAGGVWVDKGCRALFVLGEPASRPPIGGGTRITCASNKGKQTYCRADTRGYARLERQLSRSPCTLGYTWGYDDRGVWVTQGCRGEFVVGRGGRRRSGPFGR
jgi:hypothetical protein